MHTRGIVSKPVFERLPQTHRCDDTEGTFVSRLNKSFMIRDQNDLLVPNLLIFELSIGNFYFHCYES